MPAFNLLPHWWAGDGESVRVTSELLGCRRVGREHCERLADTLEDRFVAGVFVNDTRADQDICPTAGDDEIVQDLCFDWSLFVSVYYPLCVVLAELRRRRRKQLELIKALGHGRQAGLGVCVEVFPGRDIFGTDKDIPAECGG